MSPRFTADPTATSAVLFVPPKGEYEFEIGKPKAFQRTKKGGGESIGVMYMMAFADGQFKGKRNIYSCYTGSEGGLSYAKRFLMAALGFEITQDDEEKFNQEFKGKDWDFETSTGECGDMWNEVAGKKVLASTDVRIAEDTGEQTLQWIGFRPVKS